MADPPAATIDDWTRADAGTFHSFHHDWLAFVNVSLNDGFLPPGFYSQSERRFGAVSAAENESDILALETPADDPAWAGADGAGRRYWRRRRKPRSNSTSPR